MKTTLKQLRYIYTVLVMENISRAAEKCFVSQPAMSQSVQEFEQEHNLLLFERIGRTLKITAQGEEVKKELAILLLATQEFEQKVLEISDNKSGKVTIGIPPVVLTVYFYDIISKFMLQHPSIELDIVEMGANRLIEELLVGKIELAILIEPFDHVSCQKHSLTESTFSVVVHKDNPLNQRKIQHLEDIGNHPLVLLNEEFQLYDVIMKSFEKRSLTPEIVFKSKQWDLLINMVKHNLDTISILPTPIVDQYEHSSLVSYPIDLDINWEIILVERKTLNRTVANRKFIDFVTQWFAS